MKTLSAIAIGLAMIATGCATRPDVSIDAQASLQKFSNVEVAPAQNETGNPEYQATADTFGQDLVNALQSNGFGASSSVPAQNTLVVKPSLVHYEPGSAVVRWILPGAGRTQATVKASLVDKASGESVGDLVSSDQVSGGGLYSIGQDRLILSRLASDMADAIANRIRAQ